MGGIPIDMFELNLKQQKRLDLVLAALESGAYNRPNSGGIMTTNLRSDVERLEKFIEEVDK